MSLQLTWLGHASFRLVVGAGFTIYIDPWEIETGQRADLVLVTHAHYDHLSPPDIERLGQERTEVLILPRWGRQAAGQDNQSGAGQNLSHRPCLGAHWAGVYAWEVFSSAPSRVGWL